MNDLKLGTIIDASAQRDAIHIAVAPVVATELLKPGQRIGFDAPGCERVRARLDGIGIVDPFLSQDVQPEQRCWMFLLPNTITSLRHEWTHPAFVPMESDKAVSEAWMRAFAAQHVEPYKGTRGVYSDHGPVCTYEQMIEAGREFLLTGDRYVQQGDDSLRDSTNPVEFWKHFEVITGMKVPDYHLHNVPFCCTY